MAGASRFAVALALACGGFACTFNHDDLGPRLRGGGGDTSVGTGGALDSGGADTPIGAGGVDGAVVANDLGSGGREGGGVGGAGGFLDAQSGDTQEAEAEDVPIVGTGGIGGAGGTTGIGGVVGTGGGTSGGGTPGTSTPTVVVITLAGTAGSVGMADGTGASARFANPSGVAVDGEGNVFVADAYNVTIRKITPTGVVTTFAGKVRSAGSADGTGDAARFAQPSGVAVDGEGNVFVADIGNHTIRKITPTGAVTTLAGTAGSSGSADGMGSAASFYNPSGVAVDGEGNVFVADMGNNTIRKITPAGVVTTLAGTAGVSGSADGTGDAASFYNPSGVAVDGEGNVFVAETVNNTIRKITPTGVVTTLAGTAGSLGSADGPGVAASFCRPHGVAADGEGNAFVADSANHAIRKITHAGVVTTLAGIAGLRGSADGTGLEASFYNPYGVAVDGDGNVFVADTNNHTIRKIVASSR